MKKIIPIVMFAFTASLLQAQALPEFEFTERPYFLKDGELKKLEKTDATIETKGGFGAQVSYTAFGNKAGLRFSAGNPPKFYIKFDKKVDPEDLVILSIGIVKKDRRRFTMESTYMSGSAKDISATRAKLAFKKVAENTYEITFENTPVTGEYGFLPKLDLNELMSGGGKIVMFCFGID